MERESIADERKSPRKSESSPLKGKAKFEMDSIALKKRQTKAQKDTVKLKGIQESRPRPTDKDN